MPVLKDGDFVLTESVAMMRYLAREKEVTVMVTVMVAVMVMLMVMVMVMARITCRAIRFLLRKVEGWDGHT